MLKPVDQKTLRAAIRALKIDVPIYSAIRMEDGTIQITTRNGIQTWTPPTRKTQTPRTSPKTQTRTSAAKGDKNPV